MNRAVDVRPAAERLARGVGYVVNPLVLPPLLVGAVLLQFGAPIAEVSLATTAALGLMTLPPLAFLVWMVKTGRAASLFVVKQEERLALFLFGIACTVATFAALWAILETARPFVCAVGLCVLAAAAILSLLNLRWKVSIHSTAISGFVAILAFAETSAGGPTSLILWIVLLVPLVMWARVRTRSHSVAEVVAGAGLGAAVPLVALTGLWLAGFI